MDGPRCGPASHNLRCQQSCCCPAQGAGRVRLLLCHKRLHADGVGVYIGASYSGETRQCPAENPGVCQHRRTAVVGGRGGAPVTSRSSMLHSPVHHDVPTAERRKGYSMAKVKRPRRRQVHPVRCCAWCTHPVYGDAVTVTFPDKAQVTFHVACLDQYRAAMWPRAAR